MRIAITGTTGLFGHALVQVFKEGHSVYPISHGEADITIAAQIDAVLSKIRPDAVIHAAAIPNPDTCEEDPALAYAVNVHGARHVCDAARAAGARVAYISTDAVFDGKGRRPYEEDDPTGPETVYGRTKLRAEEITRRAAEYWIFRVSVLFGPGKENFVSKGLGAVKAGKPYVAASDQLGNASYTLDLAGRIRELIEAGRHGLYHLANSGCCTRLELARQAAEWTGLNPEGITGKTLAEMRRPAKRLKYSVMDFDALRRAGFPPLRPWQDALKEYVMNFV
ncbi:MAG: NAD(P)-dependent oxidoreductase [Acidobacteriota bacterium]|nr:NAD(P)-dependent oxidoreductase [Acidobacteriota bacterium]